jgi:hypothetical protein
MIRFIVGTRLCVALLLDGLQPQLRIKLREDHQRAPAPPTT